jgi:2-methylisocitrate lyase-like PEP mutase family enzyme
VAPSQRDKAAGFRALHEGETFLIPNPWDAGSAVGAFAAAAERIRDTGDLSALKADVRLGDWL